MPVALVIIAVAAMAIFWKPFARLIDRVKEIPTPGGGKINASGEQSKASVEVGPTLSAAPTVPRPLEPPQAGQVLNEEDASRILGTLQSLQRASDRWHFAFLNYFLVGGSQLVLEWIAERGVGAHSEFDAHFFSVSMPDRLAMTGTLRDHGLILIHPLTFEITPMGKNYLAWPDRKVLYSQNTPRDRELFEARLHAKSLSATSAAVASVEATVIPAADTPSVLAGPVGPPG